MKKLLGIMLALILASTCFCAGAEEISPVMAACQYIDNIGYYFQYLVQQHGDEDTSIMMANCLKTMYNPVMVLSILQDDQYTVEEEDGLITITVNGFETTGIINDFVIKYQNDYLSMDVVISDAGGAVLRHVVIEAGRRAEDDEAMLLMLDYEEAGVLSSTCRYLIHCAPEKAEGLFTRTLGKTFDITFDLSQWLAGMEYEWHRTLLFP